MNPDQFTEDIKKYFLFSNVFFSSQSKNYIDRITLIQTIMSISIANFKQENTYSLDVNCVIFNFQYGAQNQFAISVNSF